MKPITLFLFLFLSISSFSQVPPPLSVLPKIKLESEKPGFKSDVFPFLDGIKIKKWDIPIILVSGVLTGVMSGAGESYQADKHVFEKKFGVGEYSFFGSKQWERNYVGNRYINEYTGLSNRHRSEILWNINHDFYHANRHGRTAIIGSTVFYIARQKDQNTKHKIVKLLLYSTVSVITSNITQCYLRND